MAPNGAVSRVRFATLAACARVRFTSRASDATRRFAPLLGFVSHIRAAVVQAGSPGFLGFVSHPLLAVAQRDSAGAWVRFARLVADSRPALRIRFGLGFVSPSHRAMSDEHPGSLSARSGSFRAASRPKVTLQALRLSRFRDRGVAFSRQRRRVGVASVTQKRATPHTSRGRGRIPRDIPSRSRRKFGKTSTCLRTGQCSRS